MVTKNFKVKSPVTLDGKSYAIGDVIALTEDLAKQLLDCCAVGATLVAALVKSDEAPSDDAERISAIVDAIGKLDKADGALWTGAGLPKTESLADITGWPVSAKDRDAAWDIFNKG